MIEKYFKNKDNSQAYQVLSDKTCADLDFDDLYMFIDRTNSKIGQQYLYNKLRTINPNAQQTQIDETIINEFIQNPELRISTQKKLDTLKSKDAYYITTLFQDTHIEPPKWFFVIKLLSFASVLSLVFSFFEPLFFIALTGLLCVNFVIHFWNKKNLFQYTNSIPQLLKLNSVAYHLFKNPLLKELNPKLSTSIKLINEVKNRVSFFDFENKTQGDHAMVIWLIFKFLKPLF